MNPNGATYEPAGLLLSRSAVQKWLKIPRCKLEAIVEAHPTIIYREKRKGNKRTKRWFRKMKIKEILLGE